MVHFSDSTVLLMASVKSRLADLAVTRRDDIADALSALAATFDMRSLMIEFAGSIDGLLAALISISADNDAQLREAVEQLHATLDAQLATGIRLPTAWSSALEAVERNEDAVLRSGVLLDAGQLAVRDGDIGVARAQIDSALDLAELGTSEYAKAKIAVAAARAARLDDDPDRAAQLLDRATALHHTSGDQTAGQIELERASLALHLDDPNTAEKRLRMAIDNFSAAGYHLGTVLAREQRGEALRQQGRYEESREQLEQALEEALAIEDGHAVAHSLFDLGVTERHRRDVENAVIYQQRAMKAYQDEGNRLGLANVYKELGILCRMRGAFGPGRTHFANAADNYRLSGSSFGLANCMLGEADLEAEAGQRDRARDRAIRAVDLYRAIKHPRVVMAEELLASLG